MTVAPKPTDSSWSDALLEGGQPILSAPPPVRTFELALALAGAVSAGAYIAGVLDRFFEALDDWEARKASGEAGIPDWNVTLKVLSGSSAGGICSAIAALAASRDFPPATSSDNDRENPFHHAWVRSIDIVPLLGLKDGASGLPASLLDSTALDDVLAGTVGLIETRPVKVKRRNWIGSDLKVLLTTCNLDGVAYKFPLAGVPDGFYASCVHADVARFALSSPRRDELSITADPTQPFLRAALATAAFPIGLAVRDVDKPTEADALIRRLDWRAAIPLSPLPPPPVAGPQEYSAVVAVGSIPPSGIVAVSYPAMDGGTMDNEPMELARLELAGALGRNPRDGQEACRAVILVDPLVDMPGSKGSVAKDVNILNGIGRLLTAYKNGTRASATNMALAARPDVYSRFLISPFRIVGSGEPVTGPRALAGSGLGGFLGFFGEHLRQHDFDLGRANAEHFLLHSFRLPVTNPLFGSASASQAWKPFMDMGKHIEHLPIIPLFGPSSARQPGRPRVRLDLVRLRPFVRSRVSLVIRRCAAAAVADPGMSGWLRPILCFASAPSRWLLTPILTDKVLSLVNDAERQMEIS